MSEVKRNYPKGESSRRVGAEILTAEQLETTVRRLGFVTVKMHQVMMSNLIAADKHELAEAFNDAFKPVCDWLLNFTLEGVSRETEVENGKV